jgi:predicted amidohydrolase YtcJ
MTRQQALRAFTVDAAYAAFEEKDKGTLVEGKLADFVVLDTDVMTCPPDDILKAKVLMTVVGGEIVFRAE